VLSRPGFVGHLLPGVEAAIADRDGTPCQPGEVGLIRVRPDRRWNVPPTSGKDDGWVDIGDLGWMSAAGELYALGRPSDTNEADAQGAVARRISPVHEVEHLLRLEWDAADAAAVLVDGDEQGTSGPQIWIGTVDCKDARAEQLEGALRARGIDMPVRLFAVKAIPRGVNGKVQRAQLRTLLMSTVGKSH
jgi:long-chain acyl-CoA synthetase